MNISTLILPSPVGFIFLEETKGFITRLVLNYKGELISQTSALLKECEKQIIEYFSYKRKIFKCPLNPKGTLFYKKVWNETIKIPYGKTFTYKQIAENMGNAKSYRAVANALAKNPIPLLIPCHRVIGSDGKLKGFSAGLEIKEFLLKFEKNFIN